jgi:hypothetical protein
MLSTFCVHLAAVMIIKTEGAISSRIVILCACLRLFPDFLYLDI